MFDNGAGTRSLSARGAGPIYKLRSPTIAVALAGSLSLAAAGSAWAESGDSKFAGVFATDCSFLDTEVRKADGVSEDFSTDLIFACDANSGFCGSFLGFCEGGIPVQDVQPVRDPNILEADVQVKATTFANNISYEKPMPAPAPGILGDLLRVTFADPPAGGGGGKGNKGGGKKNKSESIPGVVTGRDVFGPFAVEDLLAPPACRQDENGAEYLVATRSGREELEAIILGAVVGDAITQLSYGVVVDRGKLPGAGSQVLVLGQNFNAECLKTDLEGEPTPLLPGAIIDGQTAYFVMETPGCTKISGTRYCW